MKSARWATRSSSSAASSSAGVRQDHAANDREAVLAEKHVLCPAQPDPLGPEAAGVRGVGPVVGVRPHAEAAAADLVGPAKDLLELRRWLGGRERDRAGTTVPVVPSMEMTSPSATVCSRP